MFGIVTLTRILLVGSVVALLAVPMDAPAATAAGGTAAGGTATGGRAAGGGTAGDAPAIPTTTVSGTPGSAATIAGWQLRDSATISDDGDAISRPDYLAIGWLPVAPRSTVMAGLIQNGKYPDIFTGDNLKRVDATQFRRDWWYRTIFTVSGGSGLRTVLRLPGVIPRADVWLNGRQLATRAQVVGAHTATEIDVTGMIRPGANGLALRVGPADPRRDLVTGWIDWNPWPPDNNMGLWQDVTLHQSGPVSLSDLRVTTTLALPGLDSADVTVKAEVRNNGPTPTTTTVTGVLDGITFSQRVPLAAKEKKTVEFHPSNTPALRIARPRVWWPAPLGGQPLYRLSLTAGTGGTPDPTGTGGVAGTVVLISDSASTTFGIRDVTSTLDGSGHRVFTVNGRPLLIRSGGWASDMFLRTDLDRLRKQFDVVRDLGLNAIRLEGKLETDEFYDLADRYGILLLPGWECCNRWEAYGSWSEEDYQTAAASMVSVSRRIRNHPSILAYLIGSDNAPPARIESTYLDALRRTEWPHPVVTAAADRTSPQLGRSGMKMDGPYDWVPPSYWYGSQRGAAFGFASELSAGPSVPTLDSLRAMLTPADLDQLWRDPTAPQYHAGLGQFKDLRLYGTALARRYGTPASLEEYVRAAQLANYENTRAQFEAYAARMDRPSNPSTGIVYWMLNDAWPSLIWHLYDWHLAPNGGTYGAKKANAPLHVLWQYDTGAVTLVNHTAAGAAGLSVTAEVYTPDGTRRSSATASNLSVDSLRTATALTVPAPSGFTGAYLVKLLLRDAAGNEIDRNVYWWSTDPDVLDWNRSTWYYTPVSSYADLSALTRMSPATVTAAASTTVKRATATTTVTLTNSGSGPVPAFFVEATLRTADGTRVTPVSWSDNAVTLWPGESLTLAATSPAGSRPLTVEVAGVNVAAQTVPVRP